MTLWESTPFWGIVGLIGGAIISTTISIILKNRKTLTYDLRAWCPVLNNTYGLSDYTISLNGEPIKSLHRTQIKFKNVGNETIYCSDFADTMPLTIKASQRLFPTTPDRKHQMASFTFGRRHISHLLIIDERTIQVEFEFLKPRESFTVEVLFDGKISISGELKSGEIKPDSVSRETAITVICVFLVTVCILGYFFFFGF